MRILRGARLWACSVAVVCAAHEARAETVTLEFRGEMAVQIGTLGTTVHGTLRWDPASVKNNQFLIEGTSSSQALTIDFSDGSSVTTVRNWTTQTLFGSTAFGLHTAGEAFVLGGNLLGYFGAATAPIGPANTSAFRGLHFTLPATVPQRFLSVGLPIVLTGLQGQIDLDNTGVTLINVSLGVAPSSCAGGALPTLAGMPGAVVVAAGDSHVVQFAAPTATGSSGSALSTHCFPQSGSTFAVGYTDVTCWATDPCGTASQSFRVKVTAPGEVTYPFFGKMPFDYPGEAAILSHTTASGTMTFDRDSVLPVQGGSGTTAPKELVVQLSTGASALAYRNFAVSNGFLFTGGEAIVSSGSASYQGTAPVPFSPPNGLVLHDIGFNGFTGDFLTHDGPFFKRTSGQLNVSNFSIGLFDATVGTPTCLQTAPPSLFGAPGSFTAEATGPNGAPVWYDAPTAADSLGHPLAVSCSPAPGAQFPFDASVVSCSATDDCSVGASVQFTITVADRVGPVLSGVPASRTVEAVSSAGATSSWPAPTASDLVSGAAAVTCSAASGSLFPLGVTTVTCSATDARGNGSSASFSVTVRDTIAPVVSAPAPVEAEAEGPWGATVSYSASATDNLDGAVAVTCAPASGSIFPLGVTTVGCTAVDAAGNSGSASSSVTVLDTTPPSVTLGGLPALTNQTLQTLSVLATDSSGVASATVKLNGVFVAGLSPQGGAISAQVSLLLTEGDNLVEVSASDAAGNSAAQSLSITLDTQPPVISGGALPSATSSADLPVSFSAADASGVASASVSLNGAVIAQLAPRPDHTVAFTQTVHLREGTNGLSMTAVDAAGNSATLAFTVLLDTVAPVVALGSSPALTNQAQLVLPVAATDENGVASVSIRLNGFEVASPAPAAGAVSLAQAFTLAEGNNTIVVTARDGVGNASAVMREVRLDTSPAALTILSPTASQAFGAATVQVSVSVSDASGATVTIGGQQQHVGPGTTAVVGNVTLSQGAGTIFVTAVDDAGNASQAQVSVLIDLDAPGISSTLADGFRTGPLAGDVLPFAIQVDDLDATTVASQSLIAHLPRGGGSLGLTNTLHEGQNLVTVSVTDEVNRTSTLTRTVLYDKTAPGGAFTSPAADGAFLRGAIELGVSATDNLTGVASVTFTAAGSTLPGALAGGAYQALFDTRSHTDGPVTITATLTDGVGNTATLTRAALIDNTPPAVALAAPASGYLRGVIQLSASASDAASGVGSVTLLVNGTPVKTCAGTPCAASFDTSTLQDGPFTVSATALDNAGNAAAPASWTAVADNSGPSHFLVSPVAGATVTKSLLVAVNVGGNDFDKVECSVGGKSLGVSHNPRFSATVDLSHTLDGALDVSCVATDLAGNQGTSSATVTVHRWKIELSPEHFELRSRDNGGQVRLDVDGPNADLLEPIAPWHLALVVPGGAPVPAGGVSRGKDEVLLFARGELVASIKAGIAIGLIDPSKPVLVKLVSGTHVIDTDFITLAGCDPDDGREARNDR